MSNLISGARYFIDGFSLIAKPGLRKFVVIPLLINVVFFVALFLLTQHFVLEFNHWFAGLVPTWLNWLSAVIWFLFLISFFLVFTFSFVLIANLISAPFNSFLSENVELLLVGKSVESHTLRETIYDVPRIVLRQLSILGFYLPRAMLLLVLFFVPIVNIAAPAFWLLFHAYLMVLTYIDYPSDNHRISIPEVRTWLRGHRLATYGFGGSVLLFSMVPILNLLVMPAAVAGATKFWVMERYKKQ